MLAIELSPEVERRLEAIARREGRSVVDFAREAILTFVEDLEDTEVALQRLHDQDEKTWTLEEMEQGLDR